jgi:hypothetical protein
MLAAVMPIPDSRLKERSDLIEFGSNHLNYMTSADVLSALVFDLARRQKKWILDSGGLMLDTSAL